VALGLYLHVPFCESICDYCNFNRGLLDERLKVRYVEALTREVRMAADGRPADTIFFGGGTPSLLEPDEVRRAIEACRASFAVEPDAEVTLEVNPETVDAPRLAAFRAGGVTRLSIGVQSFDDDELARLGRVHTATAAAAAVDLARVAGFANVSLDLMFWLPGQTLRSWLRTVDRAIEAGPDHLSLYLLELYPNAPLKETIAREVARADAFWRQSPDDEAADMYLAGLERLDGAGFEQYEISNVARPGHLSRHNVKYWQGGDWRGFGCGAHSTVAGVRWANVSDAADYVARLSDGRLASVSETRLSRDERVQEALFTGLRLAAGVDGETFEARHGVEPWSRYGQALAPYVGDGLMWRTGGRFGLTRRGMLVANEILTTFV
jgi:oxygen-independent coproporphyrinogen-3 oxidase